jgi:DNA primase
MRFPPSFLEQIRARVTVSSIVGRRVQWDRRKTNAGKGDYWACCPFHTEKSPSFHADDRNGRYYCFGCKATGDIFTFLVDKDGVPFPEAVERLAGEAGLPLPEVSDDDVRREEQRASLYDIMEMAQLFFAGELQTARGAKARGYLSDRELTGALQSEFGLGYAPDDRAALRSHLALKDVTVDQMAEAGLVVTGDDIPVAYDRFRDRVTFPIRDARGRVVAFGGRALRSDMPAKYLNSPETPIYHKGDILYNFDKARVAAHAKSQLIAVEGYIDVIAMHRAGFPETVAPLGTALTENQLATLWKTVPEPILCFDGDSAGLKAAYRALDLALPLLRPGHSLRFAFLPEGKDPDDVLRSSGPGALQAVIAAADPLADVLWRRSLDENDRASPERKASFERDLRAIIHTIGDDTVKRHYFDDLKDRLAKLFGLAGARRPFVKGTGYKAGARVPWGKQAWEVPSAASSSLKAAAQAGIGNIHDRRTRMIVLLFINHPELLHEFWDEFAATELMDRSLDLLRSSLLDNASSGEKLEKAGLRDHLTNRGFGDELDRLEQQAKRLNEWFLGPAAALDDARTGLRQMFALHRKTVTLERELRKAEEAFALVPSEDNLNALVAVRDQLHSAAGSEAQVAGFGVASGRPASTDA